MRYAIAWLDGVLVSSLLPFLEGEVFVHILCRLACTIR
jgi:hypothetical protein